MYAPQWGSETQWWDSLEWDLGWGRVWNSSGIPSETPQNLRAGLGIPQIAPQN